MVSGPLCWILPGADGLLKSGERGSGLIYFSDMDASGLFYETRVKRLLTARCWCICKGDWIFVSKSCNISPKRLLSILGFCCVFESTHSPGSQGPQLATFCSLFLGSFVQITQVEPSGQMSQSCHEARLWATCLCGHLTFPWWGLLACAGGKMT